MNTFYKTFGLLAITAVVGSMLPADVWAQNAAGNAGKETFELIKDLFTGNIGLIVGLVIAAYGLWKWLISQETWGLILVIGGVLITIFPGIFGGIQEGTVQLLDTVTEDPTTGN